MIITEYTQSMKTFLADLMTDYMSELGSSMPGSLFIRSTPRKATGASGPAGDSSGNTILFPPAASLGSAKS